jgi:hypothetical protein
MAGLSAFHTSSPEARGVGGTEYRKWAIHCYRGGYLRRTALIASSSFDRNRERSFGVIGAGPPVTALPCGSSAFSSRVARAEPMSFSVNGLPLGFRTRAPFSR